MDRYRYRVSVYGHIVGVRGGVKLLACCYTRVLEAVVLMIWKRIRRSIPPKAPLKSEYEMYMILSWKV